MGASKGGTMSTTTTTTPAPWRLDGEGFLRWRGTGYKAFKILNDGTIEIWDRWARDAEGKRKSAPRILTMEDLQQFVWQQTHS
jgi:hypothetical protein